MRFMFPLFHYFYPRPPRGGRHLRPSAAGQLHHFYPRPPRGGRLRRIYLMRSNDPFLSTPSARRATSAAAGHPPGIVISIHALREEGDPQVMSARTRVLNFYPRPPRGGRRDFRYAEDVRVKFLSTPSARRATWQFGTSFHIASYFYPRPPRGGRRPMCGTIIRATKISIHALREEGDVNVFIRDDRIADFYPRPPRGGRLTY